MSCSETAELSIDGVAIRETPLTIELDALRLVGVLAEPRDAPPTDLALILLNAGAIRRTGPGRMWVDLARHWTMRGMPTLRVDLARIGDGAGPGSAPLTVADLYAPEYVDQVRATIDAVASRTGARRFALLGLCSGAYWSFHTALVDERVSHLVLLNPRLLFWDPKIRDEYDARSRRGKLFRASEWRRFGTSGLGALPRRTLTVGARFTTDLFHSRAWREAHRSNCAATMAALDRLEVFGTRTLFAFCDGEPLRDDLTACGIAGQPARWPHVEFVDLPGRDHVLRPLWMRQHRVRGRRPGARALLTGSPETRHADARCRRAPTRGARIEPGLERARIAGRSRLGWPDVASRQEARVPRFVDDEMPNR